MIKENLFSVLTLLITSFLIFFSSCSKDDPVTPPPPVDSTYDFDNARYSWKVDTLFGEGFYNGFWEKDSADIFITNVFTNRLYRIQNNAKSYVQYESDIILGSVSGDESNVGFLVASKFINNDYQPYFQKWNGNTFEEISIPQNLPYTFYFHSKFIKNENEMWFGLKGSIINFDGTEFTRYLLDDSLSDVQNIFYDSEYNLKALSTIYRSSSGEIEFVIYKKFNKEWVRTYTDLNGLRPLDYKIINNEVAAVNNRSIYKLIDSLLIPVVNVIPNGFEYRCAGFSFNDILIASNDNLEICPASFFHWNGKKWSLEFCNLRVNPETDIFINGQNKFFAVTTNLSNVTFILRGTRQ